MKRLLVLLSIFVLLISATTALAQDALEVGTPIRGEITSDAFEVEYTFSGTADSVVIIEMLAEDDDGFINDLSAQLILLDSSGSVVVDTADSFSFSDAVLVTQLPADDDYTVVATRADGRSGDTEGQYTLILHIPEVLEIGGKVEGTVTSEEGITYYVIETEEDFNVSYSKSAGDYNPQVLLSTIMDNNSDIEDYASVSGNVTNAVLGDMPAGLYILSLQEALFDFYFDEVTAEYSLSINALEG